MKKTDSRSQRSLAGYAKLFFCGFIMGGADVVPGVSGGTMAFILGIYNELLTSIRDILSPKTVIMTLTFQFKKMWNTLPWPFLLALGLGILTAIAALSTPIKWMLENRLVLILAFFFGLVLGSVVTVLHKVEHWSFSRYIALLAGGAAGFLVVGLPMLSSPPEGRWYIVLCGAIAICAMILPGISGSFMLLLLGKYKFILGTVENLKHRVDVLPNLITLGLFCAGIVIGIASFVRLLSWLLKKYNDITVAVLIGFMIGSLRKVWPWKAGNLIDNGNILPSDFGTEFWCALSLALIGLVLVMFIEFAAAKLEHKASGAEK